MEESVEDSCGRFLWKRKILVEDSCGRILWKILVEDSCGRFLWKIRVEEFLEDSYGAVD
jgi:hypothetical protein